MIYVILYEINLIYRLKILLTDTTQLLYILSGLSFPLLKILFVNIFILIFIMSNSDKSDRPK